MADYKQASPVERDGMVWSEAELHLQGIPQQRQEKPAMENALALEGLEDYDKPEDGDVRHVNSMAVDFVYFKKIHGCVQLVE